VNVKSATVLFVMLYLLGTAVSAAMLYPVMILSAAPVKVGYCFLTIDTARTLEIHMNLINLGCFHIQYTIGINIRELHYSIIPIVSKSYLSLITKSGFSISGEIGGNRNVL
jgi:hypothetical protein